jgi:hypothetical protein
MGLRLVVSSLPRSHHHQLSRFLVVSPPNLSENSERRRGESEVEDDDANSAVSIGEN